MTVQANRPQPVCTGCGRVPEEIDEYVIAAAEDVEEGEEPPTPTQYVWENEGTLNTANGHFACTRCYIEMGMPTSPYGWVAP